MIQTTVAMTDNVFNDVAINTTDAADAEPTWPPATFLTELRDFQDSFMSRMIMTKTVGLLSAAGSTYIICSLVRRKKLDRTFDRMLLSLCISDFISSMSFFLGSWLVPKNPPIGLEDVYGGQGYWEAIHPQAVGNTGTCTAQGLFMYAGVCSSVLFTGCIAISFLLQVKYRFRKKQMRLAEYVFFGVSTAFTLLASSIILADQGFNPLRSGYCFINMAPFICQSNFKTLSLEDDGNIQNYCVNDADIRGKHNRFFYLIFCLVPVAVVLLIIIVCMGILFWSVRTQELRAARWSDAAASGRDQKRVFFKSMLYIGVFIVVWGPNLLVLLVQLPWSVRYYVANFLLPIQGVLNALIYSDLFSVFKEGATSLERTIRKSIRSSWIGRKFESSALTWPSGNTDMNFSSRGSWISRKFGSSAFTSTKDLGMKSSAANEDVEEFANENVEDFL